MPRTQGAIAAQARGFFLSGKSTFSRVSETIASMCAGKKFPDVVIPAGPTKYPGPGDVEQVVDFKFPCPKGRSCRSP